MIVGNSRCFTATSCQERDPGPAPGEGEEGGERGGGQPQGGDHHLQGRGGETQQLQAGHEDTLREEGTP